jgi:polar amino acid transport system substrate-binding protein
MRVLSSYPTNRRHLFGALAKAGAAILAGSIYADFATATSAVAAAAGDALSRARRQGYIMVGFNNNKPLAYIDPQTGEFVGSGPAILRPALKNLGIPTIRRTVVDFAGIIPGLLDKRWDLSGIAFFITPPRCAQVAFTNPVARYTEGALVKKGNPLGIHSYADLAKNASLRVAIQEGDAEVDWAKQAGAKNIVLFPQEPLAVEALKEGRVDVYLNATFSLRQDIKNYGGEGLLDVASPFTGPIINGKEVIAYGGFAVRHEDVPLLNALNEQIASMHKSGELLRVQAPYGFTANDMPSGSITAKDLCPSAPWGTGYKIIRST